jgi:hypothetical protein
MDRLHRIADSNNNELIKMIDDINDIDTVRALLTYYVRAERFCDGSWAVAAENKVFLKILIKLKELLHYEKEVWGGSSL